MQKKVVKCSKVNWNKKIPSIIIEFISILFGNILFTRYNETNYFKYYTKINIVMPRMLDGKINIDTLTLLEIGTACLQGGLLIV